MNHEELKVRLEQHKMWLMDNGKGKRFVAKAGENLRSANLSYANLSYADLSSADLRSANLSYANLRYADLRYANLSYANLRSANLSSADLRYADLRYANLSYANLRSANLRYADLRYANLSYANLRSANLSSADLPDCSKGISVLGMKYSIVITHDTVFWGCKRLTFEEARNFKFSDCTTQWDENEFKLNKKILTETLRYYRSGK